ncbi:hypothetical protein J1N35_012255 [Gossypium stocksii]|uniref:Uncharacterized protein n=1 Tax=Gossypium stocksii TaxID=47602 RepID=A0A9D3W4A4_9ROSI|nr:hypothetical protein J1N35_012255 [Gossypium stocksii]
MVFEFTNMISRLRNELGKCGVKDEGLIVPLKHVAESRTTSNVLPADRIRSLTREHRRRL